MSMIDKAVHDFSVQAYPVSYTHLDVYKRQLLCNIKHASWSYEQEFRCTIGATAKGISFIEAKPKEIFIGMNCVPSHAKRLMEIADFWNIPIYKMEFDERSETYALIEKQYRQQ